MLKIIIPTLNAEATLAETLISISGASISGASVMVVDGGSGDSTPSIARELGASVVEGAPGRGRQLAHGANLAIKKNEAKWILFIHADSVLSPDWMVSVTKFMNDPANKMRGAYFRLAFSTTSNGAKRVAGLANWRAKTFGLPYGDQGLLISTEHYQKIGGFNQGMNLMEDVDMVRRIGKKNLVCLNAVITTSPVRYLRGGWWARPMRNLVCLLLYYVGANQETLKRIYK
ncbi:MAG: TIGR04283 family arsenosugar biosynthesis glycosyltransferase [Rhodospirillaceae bacterium]|nr:TIGR04283 family arsenosugar biosynthesis glycosyltransferase [Rhodospirillaceae bacterium]